MGMVDALTKFYEHIEKPETNEIFFKYDNMAYQICFCGHYIRTENLILGLEDEYCFPETGNSLTTAFLNAKVNEDKDKTIREILSELSDNDLIVTD